MNVVSILRADDPIVAFTVQPERKYFVDGTGPVQRIIERAAKLSGETVSRIKSAQRAKGIARVRFGICWAARQHTRASLPEIGRALGGKDHTTVINGVRRARELIATDPEFAAFVKALAE